MKTPNKGDLVIVRKKKGAFKRDELYAAEVDFFLDGYFVVRRLSDGFIVASWPDGGIHTIEEVIPREKLPKPIDSWNLRYFQGTDPVESEAPPSLYPLEVGDEVEIHWEGDRATGIGVVIMVEGETARIQRDLSAICSTYYLVNKYTGVHVADPSCRSHITRKHKPKQEMCNKKFEYKVGQKFYSTSGIKFEVMIVNANGTIAYARRISEPMWFTRIEYEDGKHVCVDDPCVTFKPIDPPLVAGAKELVSELYRNPELIERADEWKLESINVCLRSIIK